MKKFLLYNLILMLSTISAAELSSVAMLEKEARSFLVDPKWTDDIWRTNVSVLAANIESARRDHRCQNQHICPLCVSLSLKKITAAWDRINIQIRANEEVTKMREAFRSASPVKVRAAGSASASPEKYYEANPFVLRQ